jgi:hypothetical protein
MAKDKKGEPTKMEGVRQALASLGDGAMPVEIKKFVKDKYNFDMSTSMISNYKSHILNPEKTSVKSVRSRRKKAGRRRAAAPAGGIRMEDIQALKQLADRLGAEKVRQLAAVLAK